MNGHAASGSSLSVRPLKTSERVALEIVRDLVARGLTAGDHLPLEAEMVELYQASRASVREALRLLEVQGLIWLKPGPGGGPVVGSAEATHLARTASLYLHLGAATYDQLLRSQALLEALCAQQAARHPDRVEAMQPFFAPGESVSEREYRRQTHDFHATVYRLANNGVLTLLTETVTHIVTEHVVTTMDPRELRPAIVEEHADLARAIAAGEAEEAGRLMGDHFTSQHEYYRKQSPAKLDELVEWR